MILLNLFTKSLNKIRPEEMSVIDHLEALRWHLIKAVIAILVFTIISFIFMPYIFQAVIFAPARPDFWTYKMMCLISSDMCIDKLDFTLQSRNMSGQFTTHMTASLVSGLIITFPYVIWEIWQFIKPALNPGEIKMSLGKAFFVPFLFAAGILFGYYIIAPLSINFLANYKLDPSIENQFDISSYISTICTLVLGSGLMFQLPVLIYFLSLMGIVTPAGMRKNRKYAIVGIFIVAAFITPSPDMLSQMLVAIPLYFLYEISISISASVHKKKVGIII